MEGYGVISFVIQLKNTFSLAVSANGNWRRSGWLRIFEIKLRHFCRNLRRAQKGFSPFPIGRKQACEEEILACSRLISRIRFLVERFLNRMSIIRKTVSPDLLANACEKQKKEAALLILLTTSLRFSTAPGGIRTHGLSLRRRSLYPAELRKHVHFLAYLLGFRHLRKPTRRGRFF